MGQVGVWRWGQPPSGHVLRDEGLNSDQAKQAVALGRRLLFSASVFYPGKQGGSGYPEAKGERGGYSGSWLWMQAHLSRTLRLLTGLSLMLRSGGVWLVKVH